MKWGTSGLASNQILLVSICEGSYANQSAGRGGLLALRPALSYGMFPAHIGMAWIEIEQIMN